MSKKVLNKSYTLKEDINNNALLANTDGFDIDANELEYGRDHDERNSTNPRRKSGKLRKCKGTYCPLNEE